MCSNAREYVLSWFSLYMCVRELNVLCSGLFVRVCVCALFISQRLCVCLSVGCSAVTVLCKIICSKLVADMIAVLLFNYFHF